MSSWDDVQVSSYHVDIFNHIEPASIYPGIMPKGWRRLFQTSGNGRLSDEYGALHSVTTTCQKIYWGNRFRFCNSQWNSFS